MVYIFFCIFFILSIVAIFLNYIHYGKRYIKRMDELPVDCDVVIVLGAGIRADGNPCDLLADRLLTAAIIYNNNICQKVILSGDHKDDNYNEVAVMKKWIVDNNVQEDDIILDGKGFCTFDTSYNAKNVFKVESAIICTNKYHLPRAIYIARRLGIKAYGISTDIRRYDRMKKYKRREKLAQLKDFVLVNIYSIVKLRYRSIKCKEMDN